LFLAAINAHSKGTSRIIADELSRSDVSALVDVGCGLGINSFAALRRSRRLRAMLIDQGPVIRSMCATPEYKQFRDRTSAKPLNALTNRWPESDGVFLLAHFLQDFRRAERSRLLRRARAAMRDGAELWLHGHFWHGQSASTTVAAFGFYLYCNVGGAVLSVERQTLECREAGLRFVRSVQTSATQYLLIFSAQNAQT
jgi:hypothetical protein